MPANIEVPELTLMALITMLPASPNLPPSLLACPPPSPKAAATVMGFIACLRRLLASRSAASHVMSFPAAVGRIMGLLRNGSEGVAAEAAELIAVLIGGGPGDMNILTDTKGESHATIMHTKSVLFLNNSNIIIVVNRLKPMSVSPLLSMSVVEVLEAMICEPHGETTQYTIFVELLRQVAGLRRRLFALFGHPAESVRKTVAVIMRTIAEEDAIAAESMRDMLLCGTVPCCGICCMPSFFLLVNVVKLADSLLLFGQIHINLLLICYQECCLQGLLLICTHVQMGFHLKMHKICPVKKDRH